MNHFSEHHDLDHHALDHHFIDSFHDNHHPIRHDGHHHAFFHDPFFHFHYYYSYGYPWPYPYYPYGYAYGSVGTIDYGLVDTDIVPEDADVYVDGEWMGTADDFDGYPGYLPLAPGSHTLEVVLQGYAPYRLNLYVRPGTTVRVSQSLDAETPGLPSYEAPHDGPRMLQSRLGGQSGEGMHSFSSIDLRLHPVDTAVYIDGVRQTEGGAGPVPVRPGRHTVEAVRPGYRAVRKDVNVREGQSVLLDLQLERADVSDR